MKQVSQLAERYLPPLKGTMKMYLDEPARSIRPDVMHVYRNSEKIKAKSFFCDTVNSIERNTKIEEVEETNG